MAKEKQTEEEVSLADFNWDSGDDLFAEEPIVEEKEKETKPKVKTEPELEEEEDEVEEEDEDSFDFGDEEEETVSKDVDSTYNDLYKKLKDKGIFTVDTDEEDIDEETFLELQEKELEARLEESFEDFAADLDNEAKAFLKFKREGGSTKDFFKMYTSVIDVPTVQDGDEDSYKKFLTYKYKVLDGLDDEDVQDKIEWLEESGKLEKYAFKLSEEFEKDKEVQQAKLVEQQTKLQKQQEEQRKELVNDLKKVITESDKIKDWTISQKDKKELHSYMTKGVVKVGNQVLTQLQSDLQEAFKDKEKLILLAKILHSDFDVSDVKASAKTEVIRETKKTIKTGKSTRSRNKGLADFF